MAPKPKNAAKTLSKQSSTVVVTGADGKVARNMFVWTDNAPACKEDPDLVFAKCLVVEATDKDCTLKQIDPPGDDKTWTQKLDMIHNCNDDTIDPLVIRDVGLQQHPNVAASLDFLKQRFMKNMIYTTTDPLLVAINPFKDVGICTDEWIKKYRECQDVTKLPPHSFAIARYALDNLHNVNKSQTIIVTGESGAGKTEATKHCMRFFASAKSGLDLRIQNAVMAANPVLEAFGNAKTIKNNNSSRFGRFMQLAVANGGGIQNGEVKGFLLEKVRVVSQEKNERTYHIFYQFLKGADSAMRDRYKLKPLTFYANLNARSGGCYDAQGIDDIEEWKDVLKSFNAMGLTAEEIDAVLSIVSGVLYLGNVTFTGQTIDGQDNAAALAPGAEDILNQAMKLIYIEDGAKVIWALQQTKKQAGKEEVTVRVQKQEAEMLVYSLAKATYDSLFQWIINRLNETIRPPTPFEKFMGMLDIFGFEIFENNSLEQLLINITNEFLQKNFVDIVFEKESKLYREEGVSAAELIFTSNKEIIDVLIGKQSVFSCLEDACVAKSQTDEGFLSTMANMLNPNLFKKPMGGQAELKFTIAHIVANIDYSARDFISKNMDLLKADLAEALKSSPNSVVKSMAAPLVVVRGGLGKGQLIASQFKLQLNTMMDIILATESHFIRCVKPNETKKPLDWNNLKVYNQLMALSIIEALQLKKLGFSYRRPFRDFVNMFRYLDMGVYGLMEACPPGSTEERAIALKMVASMSKYFGKTDFRETKEWQIGKSMLFMKPETVKDLYIFQKRTMEKLAPAASLLEAVFLRYMKREEMKALIAPTVRAQARCRQILSKKCGVQPDFRERDGYAPAFRTDEIKF